MLNISRKSFFPCYLSDSYRQKQLTILDTYVSPKYTNSELKDHVHIEGKGVLEAIASKLTPSKTVALLGKEGDAFHPVALI